MSPLDTGQLIGCALLGGTICFLAAGYGGALLAALSQLRARSAGQVFLDKFGQQTTRMSLWSLAISALLGAGSLTLAWLRLGLKPEALSGVDPLYLAWPGGLLGLGVVLLGLSLVFWSPLKKRSRVHVLLCLLAAVALVLFVPVLVNVLGHLLRDSHQGTAGLETVWWAPVRPFRGEYAGLFLGQLLVLGPGCAGAWMLVYVLRRRDRDDFGRDYYRYAAPLAARWAMVFPLQVLFAAWMVWQATDHWQVTLNQETGWVLGVFLVMTLLAALLWFRVLRSAHPMREKAAMIGGAVCVWMAVWANALSSVWLVGGVRLWG
jgi:hypothetical protein